MGNPGMKFLGNYKAEKSEKLIKGQKSCIQMSPSRCCRANIDNGSVTKWCYQMVLPNGSNLIHIRHSIISARSDLMSITISMSDYKEDCCVGYALYICEYYMLQ